MAMNSSGCYFIGKNKDMFAPKINPEITVIENMKNNKLNSYQFASRNITSANLENARNEEVPEGLFEYCPMLSLVKLKSNISYIGSYAFTECSTLKNINTPENTKFSIHEGAFYRCWALDLNKINFKNVTHIGKYAFWGAGVENFKLENLKNCNKIETAAFYACYNLYDVNFKNSPLKRLESEVFRFCENLSNVTLNSYIAHIDRDCFSGCTNLSSISNTEKVRIIGSEAFYETSLTSFYFPEIRYIGSSAFVGNKFSELTVESKINFIGKNAFASCIDLNKCLFKYNNGVTLGDSLFSSCNSNLIIYCQNSYSDMNANPNWNSGYEHRTFYNYDGENHTYTMSAHVTGLDFEVPFSSYIPISKTITTSDCIDLSPNGNVFWSVTLSSLFNTVTLSKYFLESKVRNIGSYGYSYLNATNEIEYSKATGNLFYYNKDTTVYVNNLYPKNLDKLGPNLISEAASKYSVFVPSESATYYFYTYLTNDKRAQLGNGDPQFYFYTLDANNNFVTASTVSDDNIMTFLKNNGYNSASYTHLSTWNCGFSMYLEAYKPYFLQNNRTTNSGVYYKIDKGTLDFPVFSVTTGRGVLPSNIKIAKWFEFNPRSDGKYLIYTRYQSTLKGLGPTISLYKTYKGAAITAPNKNLASYYYGIYPSNGANVGAKPLDTLDFSVWRAGINTANTIVTCTLTSKDSVWIRFQSPLTQNYSIPFSIKMYDGETTRL